MLAYKPDTCVNKLLTPENAVIISACSGIAEIRGPTAAAVILPLPTPVAMANEYGWSGVIDAKRPDAKPIKIEPKTVPKIYIAITPRPSGDDNPYRSVINARFCSLPTE